MAAEIWDTREDGSDAMCHACCEWVKIWAEIMPPANPDHAVRVCSECLRLLSLQCRKRIAPSMGRR